MSCDQLTDGQGESLGGWILGHVGRLLDDMKTLKMHPHRVCGIRQAPMGERIRRKQVAKLIVDLGFGDSRDQPNGGATSKSDETYQGHAQPLAICDVPEVS